MTDDTVRYALESEPSTLDPAKSTALAESNVELALFEGLTRLDEHEQPQPAAAKKLGYFSRRHRIHIPFA